MKLNMNKATIKNTIINNKYQKIKELPPFIRISIVLLPVFVSFYLFFYFQKLKVYKNIQKDIKTTEYELTKARKITGNIQPPGEKEKSKWEDVNVRLEKIPSKIDVLGLMENISRLETAHNISDAALSKIRVSPVFNSQFTGLKVDDILLKISFFCKYRDLAYFIKGVDTLPHGAVIESLGMKVASYPLISAEIQIRPIGMER